MGIRVMGAVVIAVALVVTTAAAAAADAVEGDVTAKRYVEEAIRILQGQPEMADLALEKVNDALKDDETEGVDLTLAGEAQSSLESGSLQDALELLERSIGQKPRPSSPDERAIGGGLAAPSGTAGAVLLGVAALLGLVGLIVVRRVR